MKDLKWKVNGMERVPVHVGFEEQWKRIDRYTHHRTCGIVSGSGRVGLLSHPMFEGLFFNVLCFFTTL